MRVVCMSDTHGMHGHLEVPLGDLLIHGGDLSGRGTRREVEGFARWFREQPHRHKVVIAGNHDFLFEKEEALARELLEAPGVHYLHDSGVSIEGLGIWGSPWQPWFHDWAFNLPRGEALAQKWRMIPDDTELLVTHGPPFGVLDRVARGGHSVGCEALAERLGSLEVGLHVFGHIHEAYGVKDHGDGRFSVNASIADLGYRPVQPPVVLDWDGRGFAWAEPGGAGAGG